MLYVPAVSNERGQALEYFALALALVGVIVLAWLVIGATAVAQAGGLESIHRFAEALGF